MLHFPHSFAFAWVYCLLLIGLLLVASYTDLRRTIIPKWLTIPTLVLALVLNVIRGAWLGTEGKQAWLLAEGSPWIGSLDGLLFALAGFAVGFGLFFVMFVLRTAGRRSQAVRGDERLCRATTRDHRTRCNGGFRCPVRSGALRDQDDRSEVRGQRSEVRGQRSEVRGRLSDF